MVLINIGYENYISSTRIVTVVTPDSAPIKRLVQESRDTSRLIDATNGRKTQSVILTDSDHIVLSAMQPSQIKDRMEGKNDE